MNKHIVIQDGVVGRRFDASRIVIPSSVENSDTIWVPKSERQIGTKLITKNGYYAAKDDGLYAWSSVNVNVDANGVSGKYEYAYCDDDGNLQIIGLPEYIIAGSPLKITYRNGESINFAGLYATAYDANDEPWTCGGKYPNGIIPARDLILPVTEAWIPDRLVNYIWFNGMTYYSSVGQMNVGYANGAGIWHQLPCTISVSFPGGTRFCVARDATRIAVTAISLFPLNGSCYYGLKSTDNVWDYPEADTPFGFGDSGYGVLVDSATGETFYYAEYYGSNTRGFALNVGQNDVIYGGDNMTTIARRAISLCYGPNSVGYTDFNKIPVLYERPGDKKILESSFDVVIKQ